MWQELFKTPNFAVLVLIVMIIFVMLLLSDPNDESSKHDYFRYGSRFYNLDIGSVYDFDESLFNTEYYYEYQLKDPNKDVILISEKINYNCCGLIGPCNIIKLEPSDTALISLSKNDECFPNGGLKPKYLIVMEKIGNFNGYWASSKTPKLNSAKEYYDYFYQNYVLYGNYVKPITAQS